MVRAQFPFDKGIKRAIEKLVTQKSISLTQQLDKDKSILGLVAQSKK
jgi:hypothetical protein